MKLLGSWLKGGLFGWYRPHSDRLTPIQEGKSVGVAVKLATFESYTRMVALPRYISSPEDVFKCVRCRL